MENNEVYDLHNLVLDDNTTPADDRKDPEHEPARLTADAWKENNYYAVTFKADPGDASKAKGLTVVGYDDYTAARDYLHEKGYYITGETFQTEADLYAITHPGLLSVESIISSFESADLKSLEIPAFENFSKIAKIRRHDTVIIAADTGGGKSSLAINFMYRLSPAYPCIYINLEMDEIDIVSRLISIHTGEILDKIECYQSDPRTAEEVKTAAADLLKDRQPIQLINDLYQLEDIENTIAQATEGREEPTLVFIDHALRTRLKGQSDDRYSRFSDISERLRDIVRKYNIILFPLLQMNRESKKDRAKRPTNSSLKESGSWENDATQIIFIWDDPGDDGRQRGYKLLLEKNRHGKKGADVDTLLNYRFNTQTITEAKDGFVEIDDDGCSPFDAPDDDVIG